MFLCFFWTKNSHHTRIQEVWLWKKHRNTALKNWEKKPNFLFPQKTILYFWEIFITDLITPQIDFSLLFPSKLFIAWKALIMAANR